MRRQEFIGPFFRARAQPSTYLCKVPNSPPSPACQQLNTVDSTNVPYPNVGFPVRLLEGQEWSHVLLFELRPIYTMDHEVGPWKRTFFNGLISWSNFHERGPFLMVRVHGPISQKINFGILGPLTRCKPNVNQEE